MALYARVEAASLRAARAELGLLAIVGPTGVLSGQAAAGYEQGARYGSGRALCVVRPRSTDEVQGVVRFCAEQRIRLVVQGANTGLTGASTPDASGEQVVLSMERMRSTRIVDAPGRTVTVDAGVTLEDLNEALRPHDLWFPVDLGANPQVGGMIAANTGGTRLIRYGDVRHNLLAVEAVLFHPAGERVRFGRALRKDNTGIDLKQILVGASGATGVITQAVLEVHQRPKQSATALVAPASEDAVLALLLALESELGDFLAAFEGISAAAIRAACDHVPGLRVPFETGLPEFTILIELESSCSPTLTGLDLEDVLGRFLQERFGSLVLDAIVGSGEELWRLRHAISEGTRRLGRPVSFDISVPRARLMAFRRAALALAQANAPQMLAFDFGHIADGGMHLNFAWPDCAEWPYDETVVDALRQRLYALVVEEFGGSFSAEHGVGPHNQSFYDRFTGAAEKSLAGRIQRLVDPSRLCGVVDFGPLAPTKEEVVHT
jgi:FAD/FMN-containing dehydrogenase